MRGGEPVRAVLGALLALSAVVPAGLAFSTSAQLQPSQPLDVIYVPTPTEVVRRMLATSNVGHGDVVFDLGSGDGRIPIAAVKDFGAARGVGIELDPQRIAEARANAIAAGVSDRVEFLQQDLFEADLSSAHGDRHVPAAGHKRQAAAEVACPETGHPHRVAQLRHGSRVETGPLLRCGQQPHTLLDRAKTVRVQCVNATHQSYSAGGG